MFQLQLLFPWQGLCRILVATLANWILSTHGTETTSRRLILQLAGSPVERLSADIVVRIAQLGSQDSGYCDLPGEFAILASHVCSHWRRFVVGCPSLWTDVAIHNVISGELNTAHASMFLTRSGQLPLNIAIVAEPGYLGGQWISVSGAIAGLIVPHIHRVRKFHLTYSGLSRVDDVMGIIPRSPAPILEVLSIRCTPNFTNRRGGRVRAPLLLPFLQSPAHEGSDLRESAELFPGLRDLSFSGASPRWSTFSPRNLRSLELNGLGLSAPTGSELCAVLQATASTLVTLVINDSCSSFSPFSLSCTLPVLESLSLGACYPTFLECFVAWVDVPSLTELSLLDTREHNTIKTSDGFSQAATIASVLEYTPLHQIHTLRLSHLVFLPSSPPNATAVTTADCDAAPRSLFVRLQKLERLTLVHPDAHTVHALSHTLLGRPTARPAHPMPFLSHLSLECINGRKFVSILNILNERVMLDSAVPPVPRLERVTVRLPRRKCGQLDLTESKMLTEVVADEVRYEDMDYECPIRGETLNSLRLAS
ncbi:hypothetical protein BD779DRAFT_1805676 [Infundibulicybe gibba]|nr:hypothetical protein BD779DRAFT_1805676 [Infundibulicybe gibba]